MFGFGAAAAPKQTKERRAERMKARMDFLLNPAEARSLPIKRYFHD
jgi:hypothetical protein